VVWLVIISGWSGSKGHDKKGTVQLGAVILATWESEIGRIKVGGQTGQVDCETSSAK
jgi:hypothetical protein